MDLLYKFFKACLDPLFCFLIAVVICQVILWKTAFKKISFTQRYLLPSITLLFFLFSISPTKNVLFYWLEKDFIKWDFYKSEPLDYVIVLAGGSYVNPNIRDGILANENPSRLLHGLQMYKTSGAKYLICSGIASRKSMDAEIMGNVAILLGVDPKKVIVESRSRNTREHAIEINRILKGSAYKIGLVTSAYHMKRSLREFEKYFETVIPLPSEYYYNETRLSFFSFIPNSANLHKSAIFIREFVGNQWYKVRYYEN